MTLPWKHTLYVTAIMAGAVFTSSCSNMLTRLSEVGKEPRMSSIENPLNKRDYRPISMPMPTPDSIESRPNSLWRPGARAFFKDQRAGRVGDILTVVVKIEDEAELASNTSRSRNASESLGIPSMLGLEASINDILPNSVLPENLASATSSNSHTGNGTITREETITVRLAALILQVLPNGNMVIAGRQEVRVNAELRELAVTGVIRPEDIRSDNTIESDKIAEVRIAYGGRGTITDVQSPRYGQEFLDIILPF